MVVHERLEFADDLFLDALQNYNKKMTYARVRHKKKRPPKRSLLPNGVPDVTRRVAVGEA